MSFLLISVGTIIPFIAAEPIQLHMQRPYPQAFWTECHIQAAPELRDYSSRGQPPKIILPVGKELERCNSSPTT